MRAPGRFAEWLSRNEHVDRLSGRRYHYRPRSDAHSKALCQFILHDLLDASELLEEHAARGLVVYGINFKHTWEGSGKAKTIDLALGTPTTPTPSTVTGPRLTIVQAPIREVLISCEAKSVMTEHVKSEPRLFDELNSSHEIVHRGKSEAIAAGLTVINLAKTFVSPLRQKPGQSAEVTLHNQPHVTEKMINHLRGLKLRDDVDQVGFDAYATIIVDCDYVGEARLITERPAPQPGDPDYYGTFVKRVARFYLERFSELR